MDEKLAFFRDNGYWIEHAALSAEEIEGVIDGMAAADLSGVGGSSPQLLHRTTALDGLLYHPSVFPMVERIFGAGAHLCGFTWNPRAPQVSVDPPAEDLNDGDPLCLARHWHREDSGNIEGAASNEYMCPAVQCFFYLDDVDERTHCTSVRTHPTPPRPTTPTGSDPRPPSAQTLFSSVWGQVIPESAETKRSKPTTRAALERDGRKHDGLLRIHDYGPHTFEGGVPPEYLTPTETASYLDPENPTWLDGHGRRCPRRVGGKNVYTKAGGCLLLNNASFHCL